jgi:hypothetical protein
MDQVELTILAAAVILVILVAAVLWWLKRRRRTHHLETRFGPEYRREVERAGGRSEAEAALRERETRVDRFEIRPLSTVDRDRFSQRWRRVQTDFVDQPSAAVRDADALVVEVMRARGYPVADDEEREVDLSANHPEVATDYRATRRIAERNARREATTEDLRQAMVHHRSLFDHLLDDDRPARKSEVA